MGDDALKEGTVLASSYRIVRPIGEGGMGTVYEAVHQRTEAPFAIKVLASALGNDDTLLERFRREAEVTSRLKHPNIVKVFDFDRLPDGRPFLAMELLSGKDLAAAGGFPLPLPRVAGIIDQIALALSAAHEAGVVHRDLKPANIFIEPLPGSDRELVRVLDFGISKLRNAPGALTRTAAIIGTPHYMSPEQATGRSRNIDGRSDQFSLAAIAYELLTGRRAFGSAGADEDDDAMAIIFRVVHQQPPSWTSMGLALPAVLEQVVMRGLAKEPAQRFPTIRAFGEAFMAAAAAAPAVDGGTSAAGVGQRIPATLLLPDPAPARPTTLGLSARETTRPAPRGRGSLPWAVGASVAVAAAVVAVVALRTPEPRPSPLAFTAPLNAPAPPEAEPAPARRGPPRRAAIRVDHAPEALTVWEDGHALPLPLVLPDDGIAHRLVFKAPGHRELAVDVVGRDGETVSLAAMAPTKPATAPATVPVKRTKPRPNPTRTRNEDIL